MAALLIFAATYALLSFQNIPGVHIRRPAAALLGATAMVAFGVLSLEDAYRLVDLDTLCFLLGMMIIVGYLEISGFFEAVERLVLERAGTPRRLLALLIASSGLLSALFMNDTVCLMFAPLLLRLLKRSGLRPNAYLIALATSSNIGSAMTPMGNPQNMIIAVRSGIGFWTFVGALLPLAVLGLAANYFVLRRLYASDFGPESRLQPPDPAPAERPGRLLWACLAASAFLLALFAMDVRPSLAAIATASLLILAGAAQPRRALEHVDWELLLMFSGLFVVTGALRGAGLMEALAARLGPASAVPFGQRIWEVSASAALASNVVSNVPCVVFFSGLLEGARPALWLALAFASTVAGNLTLIGSMANLIVFEAAEGEAEVGFWEYAKAGAPLALVLIALGTAYLTFL